MSFWTISCAPKNQYRRRSEPSVLCLAAPRGFEPLTYRLGGGRSILLSYGATGSFSVSCAGLARGFGPKPGWRAWPRAVLALTLA